MIEDLISTGGSSLKVVDYLRKEGYEVLGMAAIFTYGFQLAADNFKEAQCDYAVLSDYSALIKEAVTSGYVETKDIEALEDWRKEPASWKQ